MCASAVVQSVHRCVSRFSSVPRCNRDRLCRFDRMVLVPIAPLGEVTCTARIADSGGDLARAARAGLGAVAAALRPAARQLAQLRAPGVLLVCGTPYSGKESVLDLGMRRAGSSLRRPPAAASTLASSSGGAPFQGCIETTTDSSGLAAAFIRCVFDELAVTGAPGTQVRLSVRSVIGDEVFDCLRAALLANPSLLPGGASTAAGEEEPGCWSPGEPARTVGYDGQWTPGSPEQFLRRVGGSWQMRGPPSAPGDDGDGGARPLQTPGFARVPDAPTAMALCRAAISAAGASQVPSITITITIITITSSSAHDDDDHQFMMMIMLAMPSAAVSGGRSLSVCGAACHGHWQVRAARLSGRAPGRSEHAVTIATYGLP
jgi:hypothetical protein